MSQVQRGKPILFSAPMIQALLDGRKTQTRPMLNLPHMTHRRGAWETNPWVVALTFRVFPQNTNHLEIDA